MLVLNEKVWKRAHCLKLFQVVTEISTLFLLSM